MRRIARLARVGPGDLVVEIGAGLGSLTLALAETGATVTAIEADRHLLPALVSAVEPAGVRVVAGDARHLDWTAELGEAPHVLVANLPYNVATSLVLDVLEHAPMVERMLVMLQREVGERLAAGPGSRVYGIPSVKRAWWAAARVVAAVPATVFVPRPKVDSVLLEVVRRPPPAADPAATSPSSPPASPSGARCCAARWRGASTPRPSSRPASRRRLGPRTRRRRLVATCRGGGGEVIADAVGRGGGAGGPGAWRPVTVVAPAKLTLRLRVTGVRADGYHLIEAEMVALDLVDELTSGRVTGSRSSTRRGTTAPGRPGRACR